MKKKDRVHFITQSALIAAVYVILTHFSNMLGLANGAVQIRLSEVLTVLPYFTPAGIYGLGIGCFIANLTTGCAVWDIIFGTLATVIGAVGTRIFRKAPAWFAPIPPIIANVLIVPFVIANVYGSNQAIPYLMLTVGIGEVISCGILGNLFLFGLKKNEKSIKWAGNK